TRVLAGISQVTMVLETLLGSFPYWPVAAIVGWVSTFPLDVVKTRIQGTDQVIPSSIYSERKCCIRRQDNLFYLTLEYHLQIRVP
ncbi:hypothetical protein M378DRAFT_167953, partial [Amanita muscaria Koide BX008]